MTIPIIDSDEVVTLVSDATATTTEPYYVVDEAHISSEGEDIARTYIHTGQTNGTTPVEVTDSADPTIEKRVELKSMTVHNADTVTRTLTLSFKRVSTSYTIWSGALTAGQTFWYAHDGSMGVI